MKYPDDFKVEYKSEEPDIRPDNRNRYLKVRIIPSQLSPWQRLFCNKWHYVYKNVLTWRVTGVDSIDELLDMTFNYKEARTFVTGHQTWGEIVRHQNNVILQAERLFSIYGEKWDF